MKVWGALLFLFAVAAMILPTGAAEVSQLVVRINPVAGEASPSATLEDCLAEDVCMSQLIFAIGRVGGNPGGLAGPQQQPVVTVDGNETRYQFAPPKGQRFCRAELVKLSVAPTFGDMATEMRFEVSATAASVTVRLPPNAPRAWFDGIAILVASSASDASCTLTDAAQSYECKGRCVSARF